MWTKIKWTLKFLAFYPRFIKDVVAFQKSPMFSPGREFVIKSVTIRVKDNAKKN